MSQTEIQQLQTNMGDDIGWNIFLIMLEKIGFEILEQPEKQRNIFDDQEAKIGDSWE